MSNTKDENELTYVEAVTLPRLLLAFLLSGLDLGKGLERWRAILRSVLRAIHDSVALDLDAVTDTDLHLVRLAN